MRWATALACAASLAFATSASAADLYTQPGGVTTGACTSDTPCDLEYAIETAANSGDSVIVTGLTYDVTSPIVVPGDVTVRGGGSPRPLLRGAVGLSGPTLKVPSTGAAINLKITSQSGNPALDLAGYGNDLEITATAADAALLRGASELDTAVVHTSGANRLALTLSDGLLTGATIRHATILATGSGSTALDLSGLVLGGGIGSPTVSDSIIGGGATDINAGGLLASVAVESSSYRSGLASGVLNGGGNVDAAPALVNPAGGNYQQLATAPTVNMGANADGASTDLAGKPRASDGAPDIGAYELPVPPDTVTGGTSSVTGTSATIAGTVNPRSTATDYRFVWGTSNPPSTLTTLTAAGSGAVANPVSANLTGLTPGTEYFYRVRATSTWGTSDGPVQSFTTPSVVPTATSGAATGLSGTGATLNATVNPGGASTGVKFEWGTTTSYGNEAGATTLTGAGNTAVSAALTGLQPGQTYYYRVVADSVDHPVVNGAGLTFTTPTIAPAVSTPSSSSITTTGATLNAQINPGGATTSWAFEYGTNGSYDNEVPGSDLAGATTQNVSEAITGLLPGKTYDWRIVATNVNGTATVAGGQFTTAIAAPAATTVAPTGASVRSDGATLRADVETGGGASRVRFEYGTTNAYGQVTAWDNVAASDSPVTTGISVSGLQPATRYHYRVVIENASGTATGSDLSFMTKPALPIVSTSDAGSVGERQARLAATVNPGGGVTTWSFEYGTTTSYGSELPGDTLAAGATPVGVEATLAGLEPGTTYHYRIVASNSSGERVGANRTFRTQPAPSTGSGDPAPAPAGGDDDTGDEPDGTVDDGPVQSDGLPAPALVPPVGRATNATPASGTVRVRLPGAAEFVELTESAGIPVGSVVDATEGAVTITSAKDLRGTTQSANFTGAEFKVTQRRAAKPITDVTLTGGDFSDCTPRIITKLGDQFSAEKRRKWSRRRLWGNGHGRFRTRGRHGTATVRGTWWLTEDRCDGTLVRVRRGLVAVRDLERRTTVMVPAGDSYFAKSLAAKKRRNKGLTRNR